MVSRGWRWGGGALLVLAAGCSLIGEERGTPGGASGVELPDAAVVAEEVGGGEDAEGGGEDGGAEDASAEEVGLDGGLDVPVEEADVAPGCVEASDCPPEPPGRDVGCWEATCAAGVCGWDAREGVSCGLMCQEGGTCDASGVCVGLRDGCSNSDASDPCLGVSACDPGAAGADAKGCVEVSAAPAAPAELAPDPDLCRVWACLPCDASVELGCLAPGVRFEQGVPQPGQACGAFNRLVCGVPTPAEGDDACARLWCDGGVWAVYAREPTTCDVPVVCTDDGVVARSYMTCGGRQVRGLLGFWGFTERKGQTVYNLAGRNGAPGRSWTTFMETTSAALDLEIVEPAEGARVRWRSSVLGVVLGPKGEGKQSLLRTAEAPFRVYERLAETGGFTVELWLRLEDARQSGPARIVTFSQDASMANHNLMLAQNDSELRLWLRGQDEQTVRGVFRPALGLEWTHLAVTYAPGSPLTVYVNGATRGRFDLMLELSGWEHGYRLGVGNELSAEGSVAEERAWSGELGMIALFDEALTPEVVRQHFSAGIPRGLYNPLP